MRNQGPYLLWMPYGQVESNQSAAAAAEYQRRFRTYGGEHMVCIIAVRLKTLLCFWIVERTVCVSPTVIADNGVVVGEMSRDAVETRSISSSGPDQEQQWT